MGSGQHFTRSHVTLATFNNKDVADTCRFGNFHFKFVAFHTAEAQETAALFQTLVLPAGQQVGPFRGRVSCCCLPS